MSASEYGFQINAGIATRPYFEFADAGVAEEVVETAEEIIENRYNGDSPDPYERQGSTIEFEPQPEYVRTVKDAVEILQDGDGTGMDEILNGGEHS